jgi:hypothetical protein
MPNNDRISVPASAKRTKTRGSDDAGAQRDLTTLGPIHAGRDGKKQRREAGGSIVTNSVTIALTRRSILPGESV